MKGRSLFIIIALFSAGMLSVLRTQIARTSPAAITVPDDYATIQEAINAASPGATIEVRSGTYQEQIVVNKTISLIGENRETTIIMAGLRTSTNWDHYSVVNLVADSVSIENFTVNCSSPLDFGIIAAASIYHASNCRIKNSTLIGYFYGLTLSHSTSNLVSNNHITGGQMYGIGIWDGSRYNTLRGNNLSSNAWNLGVYGDAVEDYIQDIDSTNIVDGRSAYYIVSQSNIEVPSDAGYVASINSTNIVVRNMNITHTQGVLIAFSSNVTIAETSCIDNLRGVYLANSDCIAIRDCNLSYNLEGLRLEQSRWNVIANNSIMNNCDIGIIFSSSSENTLAENTLRSNYDAVDMSSSNNNKFYHNDFLNNSYQVHHVYLSTNTWDEGYPSGGNYWSDYTGTDANSDGIGDTPYIISGEAPFVPNRDNYPLMTPYCQLHEGDVNKDRKVDIKDIAMVSSAFGSYPKHQRWNLICDINQDGKIDVVDLARTSRNFGWHR